MTQGTLFHRLIPRAALMLLMLLLGGCASTLQVEAERYGHQGQWLKSVLTYRKAVDENPDDVTLKYHLREAELQAAEHYYQRGQKYQQAGNLDEAIAEYQRGITAMPDYTKTRQALALVLAQKEAERHYQDAQRYTELDKPEQAIESLEAALAIDPDEPKYRRAIEVLKLKLEGRGDGKLVLSSRSPITLNFRNTNLKTAFEFVAKSFGINVIFDNEVNNKPITVYARDVTFEQALNLILATTKTFFKTIGPNTILIAPDTSGKRGQYEDYVIRTFHLSAIKAARMAEILRGMVEPKKVIINDEINSLVVRDTKEKMILIEQLVANNDRKPAEIIMEVEILEINRTKAEQLGLDFGSRLTLSFPEYPVDTFIGNTLSQGLLTLPQISFDYFKQDVDARTLANPRVRVINNQKAQIHIGDRVPLRSATVQDTTGQIRYSYDYKDIGIRLTVLPDIHLDNSSTVQLALEVSSLGANLGTDDEPAYSIGTRNAETLMLLRDGETAVLGGLIRDDERQNVIRMPGLGDIPVLGWLFSSLEQSSGRTDVLLTITPHVVRALDIPEAKDLEFYSGTEGAYSSQPRFAYFGRTADGNARPEFSTSSKGARSTAAPARPRPAAGNSALPARASVYFSAPTYQTRAGEEFEIIVKAAALDGATQLPLHMLFDPQLLEFVSAEVMDPKVGKVTAGLTDEAGVLKLELDLQGEPVQGDTELVRIRMKGLGPGVSYLVYRAVNYTTREGSLRPAAVQASRVLVN